MFRALKRGEILAMLIDVPPPGTEITVDFMGAPAEVSSVPARVALRTGAWVVPAMILRGPERDEIDPPDPGHAQPAQLRADAATRSATYGR